MPQQILTIIPSSSSISVGQEFQVTVTHNVNDPNDVQASELLALLRFDDRELEFVRAEQSSQSSLLINIFNLPENPNDNNPDTNRQIDFRLRSGFQLPNEEITLGVITFRALDDFDGSTLILDVTESEETFDPPQGDTEAISLLVNESPIITSEATVSVAENTTNVITVTATDAEGDTLTFSLTGGDDQALFNIDANSGALSFVEAPDFEAPTDDDGDNQYLVQVSVVDGQGSNIPVSQDLTVTVTNINEPPVITSEATVSIVEDTIDVLTVTASDAEGDDLTFSLTGGDDQALFNIDANTGALSFVEAPDFEAPADADGDNQYLVQVSVVDGQGNNTPVSQDLTVTVTDDDTNESPVITSDDTISIIENTTNVVTVTATDNEGDDLTFSITGGDDQALFNIDANSGALTFIDAPNFEAPADADGDNQYLVQVSVVDAQGSNTPVTQDLTVTVIDGPGNESPVITSDATVSTLENTTDVLTVTASDDEADDLTFSLSGGDDQAVFNIDANSGALTFIDAPDFEAPTDADGNNKYLVQVSVVDAQGSNTPVTQDLIVTLTDEDEFDVTTPIDTDATENSVEENAANGITVGITANASDADGSNNTVTYSLTNNASGRFTIDANTGVVTVADGALLDFETNTSHDITVQASSSDGSNSTQSFTIDITDVELEFTSPNVVSVAENTTNVLTVTAIDTQGDVLTFGLSGGDDQALFNIDASSGALTFIDAPDFENPTDSDGNNQYLLQLSVVDALGSNIPVFQDLTVRVTDEDEFDVTTPIDSDATENSVEENAANGTSVGITANASDADGSNNTVTYSLTDNAGGRFTINPGIGVVTVADGALLDFETNISHDITVQASSSDGSNSTQSFTIDITDVEIEFTSPNAVSVVENTTDVLTVTAIDTQGDVLTFGLSGGDDQALFDIDANSGALSFMNAPDFENPTDSDGNNIYLVEVEVSDGTQTAQQLIDVTVTDEEPPNLDDPLFRFRNGDVQGTYLFVGQEERENVLNNFSPPFIEEGFAFNVSSEPGDELISFTRFRNNQIQGTYLFADEEESESIRQNFSDVFTEEGTAFYAYGADAGQGEDVVRFRNRNNNRYLFALGEEINSIRQNFANVFVEEGVAFEVALS